MKNKKRNGLYELRKNANLTQVKIASIIGVERSTYAKAELGYPVSVQTAQ